jgi:acyl-CoA hydrolase
VRVARLAREHLRRTLLCYGGVRAASTGLRIPSNVQYGGPEEVPKVLPILSALSVGALRGTPAWVPSSSQPATTDIVQRKRSSSWLEITYPFSTDAEIRNLYMLADGGSLRAGMFLEELDAFSADCSMRHAEGFNTERPLTVVTAAHDGLSIFGSDSTISPLSARHDLRLRGAVVSVGTSSMEVRTDLLRIHRSESDPTAEREEYLGSCFTVMVARDARTFGKAAVHQLRGGDPQAEEALKAAEQRAATRRALARNALTMKPPKASEVPVLHKLWRESRQGSCAVPSREGGVRMAPMALSEERSLDIMQPKNRNMCVAPHIRPAISHAGVMGICWYDSMCELPLWTQERLHVWRLSDASCA